MFVLYQSKPDAGEYAVPTATDAGRLTVEVAERAHGVRFESLPPDVVDLAKHCILDFVGLMLVGANEPLIRILTEEAASQGGIAEASAVGSAAQLPAQWAASINSAAGHVLAYDDVNM